MCMENDLKQVQQQQVQQQQVQQQVQQQNMQQEQQQQEAVRQAQLAQAQNNVDAYELYRQQTVNMTDTAQLGKTSFKANTAEKKLKNERINAAKQLTKKATADTLNIYEILRDMKQAQGGAADAEGRLQALEQYPFSTKMYVSSEIREHFREYMQLIKNYDELTALDETMVDQERLLALKPLMDDFRHRMRVFCEQNRVSMDGDILPEEMQAAKLSELDCRIWHDTISKKYGLTDAQTDEQRLARRALREQGGTTAVGEIPLQPLTREAAIHTHSDQLSMQSREQLGTKADLLREAGMSDVADIVDQYVRGTRYEAGYTKERSYLKKAIKAVADARQRADLTEQERQLLDEIHTYFETMTNGTLQIPEDAQVLDCTGEPPEESGNAGGGSTRNAMLRAATVWCDERDTPLFSHEPTINDLKQRLVSNCYMMASVGGLVEYDPALLKQCIRDNGDGTVTVRLFEKVEVKNQTAQRESADDEFKDLKLDDADFEVIGEGDMVQTEWVATYVRVTKEVPRIAGAVDALSAGALWMQMIEKACAYVGKQVMVGSNYETVKGYQSLWYGEGGAFLQRLTGHSYQKDMDKAGNTTEDQIQELIDKNELFDQICQAREHHMVFNAGSSKGHVDGLNAGHAYTVMGGEYINGHRMVRLRNPYSMHSLQYEEQGKRQLSDSMLSSSSDETYGQFYMAYEDFIRNFEVISHTKLDE